MSGPPQRHELFDATTFGGHAAFFCSCGHWYERGSLMTDPDWFRCLWAEHVAAWRAAEAELDAL